MTKTVDEFAPLPKRFDDEYANDGVWFQPYDDAVEFDYPAFKLALLDTSSNRFIEIAEKLQDQATASAPKKGFRAPQKLSKKDQTDEEAKAFIKNFIEISMVDWTVPGRDGKVLPFTKERAMRYFDHNDQDKRWLMRQCVEFASNLKHYQPDGQDEAPEGN